MSDSSAQKIAIIYASTSGNVEFVCEYIAQALQDADHDVSLHRSEQTQIDIFDTCDVFILATSTWRHGEMNPFFDKLYAKMRDYDFSGKKAAFVGLGDFRYEPALFNVAIDIIQKTFLDKGGEQIGKILKINGEPYHQVDTMVKRWVDSLVRAL